MRVLILNEDPQVEGQLVEWDRSDFTTVVPRGSLPGKAGIVLVDFGDGFSRVGLAEIGGPIATSKDRLRCSRLVPIDPPVHLGELVDALPPHFVRYVSDGLLPPGTGRAVLKALLALRPDLRAAVERIQDPPATPQTGPRAANAAMEKDAVGLALDFTGMNRSPIQRWDGSTDSGFLAGLQSLSLREDPIIQHDAGVFGDWDVLRGESVVGSTVFEQHGAKLTVLNVNRLPLEEALGVDLVYYHERYRAFVLVQYKRMKQERSLGWVYRPDANHQREVARMKTIPVAEPRPLDAWSYRLNFGACFFKLCKSVTFDPHTTALLPGMYLPLEYFAAAESSARGPQEGVAYGYSTLPRHLNNTQFVDLVQDGWVGTAGDVSDELREFVRALLVDGRSVVVAVGEHRNGR